MCVYETLQVGHGRRATLAVASQEQKAAFSLLGARELGGGLSVFFESKGFELLLKGPCLPLENRRSRSLCRRHQNPVRGFLVAPGDAASFGDSSTRSFDGR